MKQLLKIWYLKLHHNSRLVLDPTYPDINDVDMFKRRDWKQFYGDIREEMPDSIPGPLGKELIIQALVDANFAGERMTRRSRTGFIIVLNNAPVSGTL